MNVKKLHTALLEELFGPIFLRILQQDHTLRIVHLMDKERISRTLGIVRFRNTEHPLIAAAHGRITAGELLGKTLVDGGIPYTKDLMFQCGVCLPEWVKRDFKTDQNHSVANYSQISIRNGAPGQSFLYAEIFEIIPPEIIHLIPKPPLTHLTPEEDRADLLGFAGITVALKDTE